MVSKIWETFHRRRPRFNLKSVSGEESSDSETSQMSIIFQRIFAHRFRYFILFLGFLCLTSICMNMTVYNFTLICMLKSSNSNDSLISNSNSNPNSNLNSLFNHEKYFYTQTEKAWLMWAVAIGALIATFPFTFLYTHFGAKYVFFVAGILSGISTFFIPFGIKMDLPWFMGLRFIQGGTYAADFAVIGILCARWASLKQNGIFIAVLTCFSTTASMITNPVAGALCESSFGWPSVYYFHGIASFILFLLWIFFYTDNPATHPLVSDVELEKIHRHKTEAHIKMDSFVPYKKIIFNPIILIVWLNSLADIGSGIFLLTYVPTYINNVLHYGVAHTGWLGALPALSHIPIKLGVGYLSDHVKCVSEKTKMILFNSLACFIPSLMFAILGFIPDDYPMTAVMLLTAIHGLMGANCGGFYKCGTLVARQYSAFVIANIQFIKCITLFIAPGLVAIFVTDDSNKYEWRIIFLILSVTLFLANFLFFFMATDEPAEFTNIIRKRPKQKNEKIDS